MSFARSSITLAFTIIYLFSMIQRFEAQPKTDPDEANALNTIFAKWNISAHPSWNISGDPCSGTAIASDVTIDNLNYNPLIGCDCSYNNGTVCHITEMKVYDMNARGVIPVELQKLKELKHLDLSKNYLTGPLPAFIANLTKMVSLTFAFNALSGTIPKEFGSFQKIISLSFAVNNFSGSLPSELGNLKMLKKLYVDSAGLSGEIPSTFVNLKDLTTFHASDNDFTGKLPDFIGNWTNLEDMRIQGNAFLGPIPSSFSRLTSLNDLRIGELSNASSSLEFTRHMTSLRILILRNCMITDSLPSYIGEFENLEHLDLSFNNISGSFPQSLFSSSSLSYLFLGNNSLSGVLPTSDSINLKNTLDLSYNYLSGSIPRDVINYLHRNLVANNFIEGDMRQIDYRRLYCIQRNFPCNRDSPKYSNFAINSGGPDVRDWSRSDKKIDFEYDRGGQYEPAYSYVTENNKWAVSSVGRFVDSNNAEYIKNTGNYMELEVLYDVRLSSSSIRYYGLGLENGNYTVTLQFVELDSAEERTRTWPEERTWKSLQRRVFDIYIQKVLKEKDFAIKKEARGYSWSDVTKEYKHIPVTENFIEIHLFWAGKGTCCIPSEGNYGPSIAAVHAVPESNTTIGIGVIVGISVGFGLIILLAIFLDLIVRRKISYNDEDLQGITFTAQTFSYAELKIATDGFDKENKLGEGGFGPVYKGILYDGRRVAVKQLSLVSHQGKSQFMTEIDTISAVQHRNLVKLYGCCVERTQRMLVYEYLENNSLDQALFGEKCLDLDWKSRFEICVGIARGLTYLHEDSRPRIVHRDIKASNILLDAELNPKISDFGLAKLYDNKKTHISTRVAGTIGYLAPEYAMKGHLSEKADVFGFGVILFEILSGRPNFVSNLSSEQIYLLEWAWFLHENSRPLELIDSKLIDFKKEEVNRVFTVGFLCTQFSPSLRPTMSRVVSMLVGDIEVTAIPSKPVYLNDLNLSDFEDFTSMVTSSTISTTLSLPTNQ